MIEVTSPTSTWPRVGVAALVTSGLLLAFAPSSAQAADLATLRKQAAAAAAAAQSARAKADAAAARVAAAKAGAAASGSAVSAASGKVQGSQQDVTEAGLVLTASEKKLADAQKTLFVLQGQLQDARDYDAQVAADLEEAEAALADAREAVVAGQAELEAQRALMGSSAREAFQQQSPLESLATLVGASSPSDLTQRVQWTSTIFDTQAADQARLDVAQLRLHAARDLQVQIEQRVAADRAAAAAQLTIISDLEKKAADAEAVVAALVAQNQADLSGAQQRLATDKTALAVSQAAQTSAAQALAAAQGELAASNDAYQQALADAKSAEQEVKALIASQGGQSVPDNNGSGGGAGGAVSAYGFIRPIDAQPGSPFGMRFHPILHVWMQHAGQDFGAPCGTPIYAARSGVVLEKRLASRSGLFVVIGHGKINGTYVTTSYLHQSRSIVSVGQQVSRGQVIGYVGNTGLSTTCHLHFDLRHNGVAVNPMNYIP